MLTCWDEIERRLSDALAPEAKSVAPQADAWDRQLKRRPVRRPRTVAPWLAAAAAVAVIALGATIAVRGADGHRTAAGPGLPATSALRTTAAQPVKDCDDASKAKTVTIIGASSAPTTAQLFFPGAAPPQGLLCSRINAQSGGHGGGTGPADGAVGYYTGMQGEKTYLTGAFSSPTTSLTFVDRQSSWTLTITATTPGVTNLESGWFGYFVLAPSSVSDVQITAKSAGQSTIGTAEMNFGGGWVRAPGSGGSAVVIASQPIPVTGRTGTGPGSSPSVRTPAICEGANSGAGMSDVGVKGATIEFTLSTDGKTLCFFNGVAWTTAQPRPGQIRFLGTTETVSGASAFGAVVGDVATMTWMPATGSKSYDLGSFMSNDGLTYFVAPAAARTVTALDGNGKTVATVDLPATASTTNSTGSVTTR